LQPLSSNLTTRCNIGMQGTRQLQIVWRSGPAQGCPQESSYK